MAESESTAKESDVLYEKLLNKCGGQGAEKAAAFCDEGKREIRQKRSQHQPFLVSIRFSEKKKNASFTAMWRVNQAKIERPCRYC